MSNTCKIGKQILQSVWKNAGLSFKNSSLYDFEVGNKALGHIPVFVATHGKEAFTIKYKWHEQQRSDLLVVTMWDVAKDLVQSSNKSPIIAMSYTEMYDIFANNGQHDYLKKSKNWQQKQFYRFSKVPDYILPLLSPYFMNTPDD